MLICLSFVVSYAFALTMKFIIVNYLRFLILVYHHHTFSDYDYSRDRSSRHINQKTNDVDPTENQWHCLWSNWGPRARDKVKTREKRRFDIFIRPAPEAPSQKIPKQPLYSHYNTKLANSRYSRTAIAWIKLAAYPHLLGLMSVFSILHDDVTKWKHFPRYRPFVRGIHRSPENSPHKG